MTVNKRLRTEEWLDLGLKQLTEQGAAGLTLECLCKKIGRTRGSFYHHFKDHSMYIEAMIVQWKKISTDNIITEVNRLTNPVERKKALTSLAMALDKKLEFAMRQYAQSNPTAAKYQNIVDEIRIEYLTEIYEKVENLPKKEAENIAKLEYAAYVGGQMIQVTSSETDLGKLNGCFKEMSDLWVMQKRK